METPLTLLRAGIDIDAAAIDSEEDDAATSIVSLANDAAADSRLEDGEEEEEDFLEEDFDKLSATLPPDLRLLLPLLLFDSGRASG